MKKTLIALLALSGMAMGEDTVISNANQTAVLLVDGGVKVSNLVSSMTVEMGTQATPGNTGYRNSFTYTPVNVGASNEAMALFTLNFTITEIEQGVQAQGMTIDFFSLNGGGKPQNNTNGYHADVYLGITGQDPVIWQDYGIITSKGNNTYTGSAYASDSIADQSSYYQLNLPNVEWAAGDYIMTVAFTQEPGYTSGCFGGIGNVTLHASNVPEPATGTLSLLALAGLCIRRRK